MVNKILRICYLVPFITFCILILSFFADAKIDVNIDTKIDTKDSFTLGEQIYFDYSIVSSIERVVSFTSQIYCPNAPAAFSQEKTVSLEAKKPFFGNYSGIIISPLIEPQECRAYIEFNEPDIETVEKTFEIKTDPSFKFNIRLDKKIFVKNEDININYDSETNNLLIISTLTYPDKTTKQITLPTSIKADQIGTYILEVTASKQDYLTSTKQIQFAVIEKSAEIKSASVCNVNGVCDGKENYQNCPQDCPFVKAEKNGYFIYILIGVLVLVVLFILIVFFIIKKREE